MIGYQPDGWYGWSYLYKHFCSGSVFPKALPPTIFAAVLGGWIASPKGIKALDQYQTAGDIFGNAYGVQMFGIVFGFLCIGRLNICYVRYWEGASHVKMMHSNWLDAASQAVGFDQVKNRSLPSHDPFCCYLVHLFSQLSALALISLHLDKPGESVPEAQGATIMPRSTKDNLTHAKEREEAQLDSSIPKQLTVLRKAATNATFGAFAGTQQTDYDRRRDSIMLNHGFSEGDVQFYSQNRGCAVHIAMNRIIRTLTTRMNGGGLPVAPPIVSRIYQELSNGLLAYNQAIKLKEVAMPFVYVQLNALLLLIFTIVTPFTVGAFTSSRSCHQHDECEIEWGTILVGGFLSGITVGSFNAMWLVADELEDPFGTDHNDICMMTYHYEVCTLLRVLLEQPWMEEDNWSDPELRKAAIQASAANGPPTPDASALAVSATSTSADAI